jgi:hypothetical protein
VISNCFRQKVQFSYFAGNKQLNQCLFPAKCVYQVFAGNADKRHRGGVSEALTVFRIPSEGAKAQLA